MKRRSFIKGLLGAGAIALIPIKGAKKTKSVKLDYEPTPTDEYAGFLHYEEQVLYTGDLFCIIGDTIPKTGRLKTYIVKENPSPYCYNIGKA